MSQYETIRAAIHLFCNFDGFWFSPLSMEAEFALQKGKKTNQSFVVDNNSDKKTAVQLEIFKREIDVDGKETRTPSEDFLVFPDQIILNPREKRNVRVTWLGSEKPKKELAFRLVAEELPIDFAKKEKKEGVQLNFLLKYVASLYVLPDKPKSKVVPVKTDLKGAEAHLLLKNEGNIHQVLNGIQISLVCVPPKKCNYVVPDDILKKFHVENVLAGGQRILKIPLPKKHQKSKFKADLTFSQ